MINKNSQEKNNFEPFKLQYEDVFHYQNILIPQLCLYNSYDTLTNQTRPTIGIHLDCIDETTGCREPYAMLTVGLGEYIGIHNAAYIDTNNLGNRIIEWLEKNNLGQATPLTKQSGFCQYPLFIFNDEFLAKIEDTEQCLKEYNNSYDDYLKYFEPSYEIDEDDLDMEKE